MSNSPLVEYVRLSPNHSGRRTHEIDTITIHCMAGDLSVETCGSVFQYENGASSNYGIDSDGRVGMYVEEDCRSWCTSNRANDQRAVTIEVANDGGADTGWHVSDKAYKTLIRLCADICKRNGIPKLLWRADANLIGRPEYQNMTVHRWFENKSCPGDYLYNLHYQIADEVNDILGATKEDSKYESPMQEIADLEIGEKVYFFGNVHYVNSNSVDGSECIGGVATVSGLYNGKHSVHLIGDNNSTVYGWVDRKYIAKAKQTTANLNLRTGTSTDYDSIGIMPYGTNVYVIETYANGWCRVYSEKLKMTGYCAGNYLA